MKSVSVIIPFYSHIDWLYEAMDSVLSQTYPIHEIIVINDGSKEDMSAFLEMYGNKIIYIYQENAGPAAARNRGIRIATGDYIAFEDSDDIWLPTKLEKQIAFMEKTGAMWSHTGFYYWWPQKDRLKVVDTSRDYGDVYLQRHVSTQIATPAVMLNRRVFEDRQIFFPEDVRNGEDDRFYLELSRYYSLALVDEPLLKVRIRGNNSQTMAIERFYLRAANYNRWVANGDNLPNTIHFIYFFYRVYSKIFSKKSNSFTDFLAKCLWTIPYALERIYVRYLYLNKTKNSKYRIKF